MPGYIHKPGFGWCHLPDPELSPIEAVWQLTQREIGQSTVIGIGGDPIKTETSFIDLLATL